MTKTMDFGATRASLRGEVAKTEAALERVRDRIGELALDCALGNAPKSELDAARAEQAELTQRVAELEAALGKVDEREASHKDAEAAKKREADGKRLAELQDVCRAAGVKVADLAGQLGEALTEGYAADHGASIIARTLYPESSASEQWMWHAAQTVLGMLRGVSTEFPSNLRPDEVAEHKRALTGRE